VTRRASPGAAQRLQRSARMAPHPARSTTGSTAPGLLGAAVMLSLALAACTATLEARPAAAVGDEDVIWADAAPANLDQYRHESYDGKDVYLVDGAWHYRSGNRWATYRREPTELARRRAVAPGAREEHGEHGERH